ncbi:MAG: DUF3795 domain-containing protein [Candidatus Brocadiia bacterium]
MPDLTQVSYCGLYCGLCSIRNRIPRQAAELRDSMLKEGMDQWGQYIPGFEGFWKFLNSLPENEQKCSCRAGCGNPACEIRGCARAKGVDVCPFCAEYPCQRIKALAKGYFFMMADAARMKEIGLDAWIAEQEERAKTGFAYVDIRCKPPKAQDK